MFGVFQVQTRALVATLLLTRAWLAAFLPGAQVPVCDMPHSSGTQKVDLSAEFVGTPLFGTSPLTRDNRSI